MARKYNRHNGQQVKILPIIIVVVAFAIFKLVEQKSFARTPAKSKTIETTEVVNLPVGDEKNQVVEHSVFTLAYADEYEQAEWVFYLLTQNMLTGPAERTNKFIPDPTVKLGTCVTTDYTKSGYDRGHLCPSADVKNDLTAQAETFYLSNISPQAPSFNRGMWSTLETAVRKATQNHDSIYVVVGPVLKEGLPKIGKTTFVAVPEYFYKILYCKSDGGHMIGFLMPNRKCEGVFTDYIVSVDYIEELTGIDFFPNLPNEENLESATPSFTWWQSTTINVRK